MKYFFLSFFLFFLFSAYSKSQITKVNLYQEKGIMYTDIFSVIHFSSEIEEALINGVELHFSYQFKIKSKKWYNPLSIALLQKNFSISYNRLTAKFNVFDPVLYQENDFKTLKKALKSISQLKKFPLIFKNQIDKDEVEFHIRFHLNKKNIPSLIKIEKVFNQSWSIDSKWTIWEMP